VPEPPVLPMPRAGHRDQPEPSPHSDPEGPLLPSRFAVHLTSRSAVHLTRESAYRRPLHTVRFSLGSPALILLTVAIGLSSVQIADQLAFGGGSYGTGLTFFWTGLCFVFVPIAVRLTMRGTGRGERIALAILLGLALYVVKIQGSPHEFTFIDEYIHLRNTQDILRSGRIFQANPLLPTAAYYPGLAAVTASLVDLTGLSVFVSGLIVVGVARVMVSACIFLIAEKVTRSARAAGVASLIYAANPMFLFWSSTFSYEDLGLPLAFFVVWWLGRTHTAVSYPAQLITVVVIFAVTVTHHISALALASVLGSWYLASVIARRPRPQRRYVGAFAMLSLVTSMGWFLVVARPAAAYIVKQNIAPGLRQVRSLVLGAHAGRQLYSGGGSDSSTPPAWYALAGFAAIAVIMGGLLPALHRAWTGFTARHAENALRRHVPVLIVVGVSALFPVTLLPRLTADGGALSSRTSEYIFTMIGCALGLLAIEFDDADGRGINKISRAINLVLAGWRGTALLILMVAVVFFGGITIGSPYFELLPPPTHPTGFPSIPQPDMVSAANWARVHLGPGQSFATDLVDSLALATDGAENPVSEDAAYLIFFGDGLAGQPARVIRMARVRYILVDWRMTYGPPVSSGGYYFSPWEPGAGPSDTALNASYLRKFASYTCSHLVHSVGAVQIFDVSGIENGTCIPRPVGRGTTARRKASQ
jgi:hypothetical protein